MDRSSNKHGARLDEEMKNEVEGQLRSGHPTRAEEWHDPEPIETEDSPDVMDEIRERAEAERGRTRASTAAAAANGGQAGNAVTVRELMSPVPVGVDPLTPVTQVAQVMRDMDIGMVLVADTDQVFGLVTDRDLVVRGLAADKDVLDADINTLCSAQLVTVGPGDTAETAAELMSSHALRRLPVVENGEAVGIVSLGDLAAALDPASTLGAISSAPPTL